MPYGFLGGGLRPSNFQPPRLAIDNSLFLSLTHTHTRTHASACTLSHTHAHRQAPAPEPSYLTVSTTSLTSGAMSIPGGINGLLLWSSRTRKSSRAA